jgi:excisionase family DNA binding protein
VPDLITTRELARALRVSESAVRGWVRDGKIKPELTTPGGQHRFVLEDVREQLRKIREG